MKQLARDGNAPAVTVDLFHPAAIYEDAAIETLKAHASAAAVRLHLIVDARDGRLDGKRIREAFPEWREASVWLCGPPGFGESLRKDFVAQGLPRDRFHRKLFEMRGPRRLLPASVLTGSWRRGYDSLDSRPPWPSMSG